MDAIHHAQMAIMDAILKENPSIGDNDEKDGRQHTSNKHGFKSIFQKRDNNNHTYHLIVSDHESPSCISDTDIDI